MSDPKEQLASAWTQNSCGDKSCEDFRLDAALRVLRGGPTHRANAELVNATEDAWRDAAGTEAAFRKLAEDRLAALLDAATDALPWMDESVELGRQASAHLEAVIGSAGNTQKASKEEASEP